MIKDYRTHQSGQLVKMSGAQAGQNASISYPSNASTKDLLVNEEIQRVNKIMQEPVESLIQNLDKLSRPLSSHKMMGRAGYGTNYGSRGWPHLKKERASTAHNKQFGGLHR